MLLHHINIFAILFVLCINIRSTFIRRQFMRGTDPIKSTWVYPNIVKLIILLLLLISLNQFYYYSIKLGLLFLFR